MLGDWTFCERLFAEAKDDWVVLNLDGTVDGDGDSASEMDCDVAAHSEAAESNVVAAHGETAEVQVVAAHSEVAESKVMAAHGEAAESRVVAAQSEAAESEVVAVHSEVAESKVESVPRVQRPWLQTAALLLAAQERRRQVRALRKQQRAAAFAFASGHAELTRAARKQQWRQRVALGLVSELPEPEQVGDLVSDASCDVRTSKPWKKHRC